MRADTERRSGSCTVMHSRLPMAKRNLEIHWKILIGLAAGLVVGLVLNFTGDGIRAAAGDGVGRSIIEFFVGANDFVGDLFLRCLRFIAVPIVLFSLIVGASSLNDIKKLSRIGGKTVLIYISTTAVAISVGLLLANVLRPGEWVSEEVRARLSTGSTADVAAKIEAATAPDTWTTMLNIVPTNPFTALAEGNMLQVVFTALAIGICLTLIPREKATPIIAFCDGLTDVIIKLVQLIMLAAPIAVFALLTRVVARMGLDVLGALIVYSLVVIGGLALMIVIVYPFVLRSFTGVGMRRFYRAIAPAQLLAFSSSSSSATLPVTMECVERRLGASEDVASFVVPLGATINMDGTALYQGVASMFIAQMYGIDLDFSQQLTIVLTATLASVGTAGVPGVGLIMLVIVLQSVGMGADVMAGGLAIIFGVDRLLDMCRTTCNVTGDAMVCAVIAHSEGELASVEEVERRAAARESSGVDENPPHPDDGPSFR
jgi:Na+/H+-dicarboxylate symporter